MIVSTTLCCNHELLIGDAIRSVIDWVDICLVIDTGSTDASLAIAKEIAGDKYRERKFLLDNDFSRARNFALDAAFELGGKWAVTLDTDERIELNGVDIRSELDSTTEGALYVTSACEGYVKERFFRLPITVRWEGPTHEAFQAYKVGCRTIDLVRFSEVPKTAEDSAKKFKRDACILVEYTAKNPSDPRWFFYLGESYRNLGHLELAIEAYDKCAALKGWDEESAWACYRSADCLCQLNRLEESLDRIATGLTRHAGIAELCWLGGYVSYLLGRDKQAIYWSKMAIANGLYCGYGSEIPRIGFREPFGLWEGPYDVIRWAESRLGNKVAADAAVDSMVVAGLVRERYK